METDLVPMSHAVILLEQTLVVRDAVFAVDPAVSRRAVSCGDGMGCWATPALLGKRGEMGAVLCFGGEGAGWGLRGG